MRRRTLSPDSLCALAKCELASFMNARHVERTDRDMVYENRIARLAYGEIKPVVYNRLRGLGLIHVERKLGGALRPTQAGRDELRRFMETL